MPRDQIADIQETIEKIREDGQNMMIICKYIFEIASTNIFYSELYYSSSSIFYLFNSYWFKLGDNHFNT